VQIGAVRGGWHSLERVSMASTGMLQGKVSHVHANVYGEVYM